MKDYLGEITRNAKTPSRGRNIAREYLQARVLGSLQRAGAMIPLAFHGGTALRFLYATGRYAEELDFALERKSEQYDFRAYLQAVKRDFSREGYLVEIKLNDQKTVHSAFVRFPSLLYELKLSPHASEVLAVRLEVDTNPPPGAILGTTIIRRYVTLQIQHHDRASLLAGKLHTVLQRSFSTGRDMSDLLWYLSDPNWPAPNLTLLNNALQQTGWDNEMLTPANWRSIVRSRMEALSWKQVASDVSPFLEPGPNPGLLTRENLLRLLE